MRKGITPIISIIILLLIAVALAGAAWAYIGGFMGTYMEKSFVISTGGAYCDAVGKFHALIVNSGTTTIAATDWANAEVTNATNTITLNKPALSIKGAADFATATGQLPGQPGKSYTLTIGTIAGVQRIPLVCP